MSNPAISAKMEGSGSRARARLAKSSGMRKSASMVDEGVNVGGK